MYHGTMAERNGVDTTIRALALALPQAPHLRLDLMGRGEGVPALKRLAAELGIADRVTFLNSVPSERIVDFVTHGDIGVISYPVDGFMELVLPTKAYEYAWLAKPMIASDTPAIRSMFSPGAATLCAPSDPAAFAAAIVDLYQHPEKRVWMAQRALADYQPYRWEAMGSVTWSSSTSSPDAPQRRRQWRLRRNASHRRYGFPLNAHHGEDSARAGETPAVQGGYRYL